MKKKTLFLLQALRLLFLSTKKPEQNAQIGQGI